MKLAISNIAWDQTENDAALDLVAKSQATGIEIAPTKLWPAWAGASIDAARAQAAALAARGLCAPALQSLLFERPDLKVFGDDGARTALIAHLTFVASLAQALGASVMVFGSPRNRDPGNMPIGEAYPVAVDVFRAIGAACAAHGVRVCIEPNPKIYQCAFLTSWREAAAFVREVDSDGVGLHLDAACIALEGDDPCEAIAACAGAIAHFHVSEPNLSEFANPQLDHAAYGAALRAIGYRGWTSIEMRRTDAPLDSIAHALDCAARWYAP